MPITNAPPGGDQLDFVEPYPRTLVTGASAATASAYFFRFRVAKPLTLSKVTYYIGAASGNVDAGYYDSADGGVNLARLASAGSTAASGSNTTQQLTMTASIVVVPNKDYWIAFASDNATLTIGRLAQFAPVSLLGNFALVRASVFPLPAAIGTASSTTLSGATQAIYVLGS